MSEKVFKADTLDDLLHQVLVELLQIEMCVEASRGKMAEIFGAILILQNPRARLSRSENKGKLFSALGEFLWYLSGSNDLDFIEYYVGERYKKESEDGQTVRSGYGERLFQYDGTIDQVSNVIELLKDKPSSRRAVIQLFDASDLEKPYVSIPCTCTLQFLIRNGELNLLVNMRSNDAYLGLSHDVFAFTMLQEVVARTIGVDIGVYQHCVGSLHLYEDHKERAQRYVDEGWMNDTCMQPMPEGPPWESIQEVKCIAEKIRTSGEINDFNLDELPSYWRDICRLLMWFSRYKAKDARGCSMLQQELEDPSYRVFLEDKAGRLQ